jgi:hypothetical protein
LVFDRQRHEAGDLTLRISPFGRPELILALDILGECAILLPSRWVYVEVSAREEEDRDLDYRWARESDKEVNIFLEGPTAMVRVWGFLEALGESTMVSPPRTRRLEPEVETSRRLAAHIAKTWGEYTCIL